MFDEKAAESGCRRGVEPARGKLRGLEERLAEVESVNARLEEAALTTARALVEVSRHWSAVYEAMRRAGTIDPETSSERDSAASAARDA